MFKLVLLIVIATFATAFVANPSRTSSSSVLFSQKPEKGIYYILIFIIVQ